MQLKWTAMNIGVFLSSLIQLHSSSLNVADINYSIDATYVCIYLLRMNISGATNVSGIKFGSVKLSLGKCLHIGLSLFIQVLD